MVIQAVDYPDFKSIVTKLLVALEVPIVFDSLQGSFWSAWALVPSKNTFVTVNLNNGAPVGFTSDFTGHTTLGNSIQVE